MAQLQSQIFAVLNPNEQKEKNIRLASPLHTPWTVKGVLYSERELHVAPLEFVYHPATVLRLVLRPPTVSNTPQRQARRRQ